MRSEIAALRHDPLQHRRLAFQEDHVAGPKLPLRRRAITAEALADDRRDVRLAFADRLQLRHRPADHGRLGGEMRLEVGYGTETGARRRAFGPLRLGKRSHDGQMSSKGRALAAGYAHVSRRSAEQNNRPLWPR